MFGGASLFRVERFLLERALSTSVLYSWLIYCESPCSLANKKYSPVRLQTHLKCKQPQTLQDFLTRLDASLTEFRKKEDASAPSLLILLLVSTHLLERLAFVLQANRTVKTLVARGTYAPRHPLALPQSLSCSGYHQTTALVTQYADGWQRKRIIRKDNPNHNDTRYFNPI